MSPTPTPRKPHLSLGKIINMNVGFFGIQFSFGLQQRHEPDLPIPGCRRSQLATLVAGRPHDGVLLVQPVIGALSDRTTLALRAAHAVFFNRCLAVQLGAFVHAHEPDIAVRRRALWILDAANNVTMEPYRYVSMRLDPAQHAQGFLTQSAFTGLAQTCAYPCPRSWCGWA